MFLKIHYIYSVENVGMGRPEAGSPVKRLLIIFQMRGDNGSEQSIGAKH